MKIKLKSDWLTYKCGSVLHTDDATGQMLVGMGHEEVHPDTPARKNADLYSLGCNVAIQAPDGAGAAENKMVKLLKKK